MRYWNRKAGLKPALPQIAYFIFKKRFAKSFYSNRRAGLKPAPLLIA